VLPTTGVRFLQGLERKAIGWALAARGLERAAGVPLQRGKLRAYSRLSIRFGARPRTPGTYVYAIRLRAIMNSGRSTLLVGKPFTVH
jgi:hypothetical protein